MPATGPHAEERARQIALRRLTRAPQSRAELERAIAARGIEAEAFSPVLDGLERCGLINDADYAAMIVRTRFAERGLARKAIAVELARRGIDGPAAQRALEQLEEDQERERAHELAMRFYAKNGRLEPEVLTRRLFGYLARRGYGAGIAMKAVADVREKIERGDGDCGPVVR